METIKTAILGFGRWGKVLYDASLSTENLRITHVVTRTLDKAEKFCRDEGLKLSDDLTSVLENDDVDAVIIKPTFIKSLFT